jgi:hypothetical protein
MLLTLSGLWMRGGVSEKHTRDCGGSRRGVTPDLREEDEEMKGSTVLGALLVILALLASSPAFGTLACGSEICVEFFGWNPIIGAPYPPDFVVLPKGPIVSQTAPFCLAIDHVFPSSPPLQGVIGRHLWIAGFVPPFTGPGGLLFFGTLNGTPITRMLPDALPWLSFVPFQAGAFLVDQFCFSQQEINGVASGTTITLAGGYTKPLGPPLTLFDLLMNAVSGVSFLTITIP